MIWDLIGRWMINHVSKFGDFVCDGIDKLLARDLYPRTSYPRNQGVLRVE